MFEHLESKIQWLQEVAMNALFQINQSLRDASRNPRQKWILFGRILIFSSSLLILIFLAGWVINVAFSKKTKPPKKRRSIRDAQHPILAETALDSGDEDQTPFKSDLDTNNKPTQQDQQQQLTRSVDSYVGEYNPDTREKEGYGVMHYKNGTVYEGKWLRNKQHGKGTATGVCVCVCVCVCVLFPSLPLSLFHSH